MTQRDDDSGDLGYLGRYGVAVVPPTPGEETGWFVALSQWDEDREAYVASAAGPILETREDALAEAGRLLDWIASKDGRNDLMQVWEQLQKDLSRDERWTQDKPQVWWDNR